MPFISTLSGKEFEAEAGETLLDAALRANVILEHSCKTGRCGACKSKVARGGTIAILNEAGLTADEKLAGWILTCARSAIDNVQLTIEDISHIRLSAAKTYPCRIQSLEKLAADVMRVVLRLPPQQYIDYHSGQYVDVIGAGGMRRSYSVANAPSSDKCIELHIRKVPDGAMSNYWFEQAKRNDLLRLHGPLGTFFLREVAGLDLVFLATGTGMAPIKALLESLTQMSEELQPRTIHVFWGGRTPADLYWNLEEVSHLCNYTPVLSRADAEWMGARGYVQQAVLAANLDLAHAAVYACGSLAMIDGARAQLVSAGLEPGFFHSDAFVSSSQSTKLKI